MKLFIAINFKKGIKYKVQEIITEVKSSAIEGRFVSNEHLHLTLEFFGEIAEDRISDIINIMNKISTKAFTLKLFNLGCFKKRTGDILWIGFKENRKLFELQNNVHKIFVDRGFELESRPYKPHVTIGRKVLMKENFDSDKYIKILERIRINVKTIDLMKSEQVNGKLIYTVIHSMKL